MSKSFNKNRLCHWVDKFAHVPILVVGDVMMDRTIEGAVHRISPEAPVPVLTVHKESCTAGGAGNVVYNLAALGAVPKLVGVRGADPFGDALVRDFQKRSLSVDGLVATSDFPTITKIRVVAGQQQIVRVDYEKISAYSARLTQTILDQIKVFLPQTRGTIISDYGKGLITPTLIQRLIQQAHKTKQVVMVDPKIENFLYYKGVDCITPNAKEAVEGMRALTPKSEDAFVRLGRDILKKLKARSLLITRGEKGMLLFHSKGKPKNIRTRARDVFDVTGAGDTVIATLALARAVGASYEEAAHIANVAAGLVVEKRGTAVVSAKELIKRIKTLRDSDFA